jgi:hypothetical protein
VRWARTGNCGSPKCSGQPWRAKSSGNRFDDLLKSLQEITKDVSRYFDEAANSGYSICQKGGGLQSKSGGDTRFCTQSLAFAVKYRFCSRHFCARQMEREGGFRALILVYAILMQPVPTTSRARIVEWLTEIVAI